MSVRGMEGAMIGERSWDGGAVIGECLWDGGTMIGECTQMGSYKTIPSPFVVAPSSFPLSLKQL